MYPFIKYLALLAIGALAVYHDASSAACGAFVLAGVQPVLWRLYE